MNKKALIGGAVFGLVAPFVGIFIGLQISTVLGNVLAFPVVGLAYLTGEPFGIWGSGMMIFAVALSIALWAIIFGAISMAFARKVPPSSEATV